MKARTTRAIRHKPQYPCAMVYSSIQRKDVLPHGMKPETATKPRRAVTNLNPALKIPIGGMNSPADAEGLRKAAWRGATAQDLLE